MSDKVIKNTIEEIMEGNEKWKLFVDPTVGLGKTVFPKSSKDQERLGLRFDRDNEVLQSGEEYNLFKMQANAGNIPSGLKSYRDKHGTHEVMAIASIKKGGTKEDVEAGLNAARLAFKNANLKK